VLRAVLDANVIVSGAILKKGIPFELLAAWRRREWELVTSEQILDEIQRVLSFPKITRAYALTSQEITDLLWLLRSRATLVPGQLRIPPTSRDPEDDHILACAREGRADYIVTGDQDLLPLDRFEGIPIVSPAAFAAILRTAG
jgi:putative PIN family toxin of toxin-antitoxin system